MQSEDLGSLQGGLVLTLNHKTMEQKSLTYFVTHGKCKEMI